MTKTKYTVREHSLVWNSTVKANVKLYPVLAVEGECDWHAGFITEVGGEYVAECDRGVFSADTLEEALSVFSEVS